jgi:hypothetical protein
MVTNKFYFFSALYFANHHSCNKTSLGPKDRLNLKKLFGEFFTMVETACENNDERVESDSDTIDLLRKVWWLQFYMTIRIMSTTFKKSRCNSSGTVIVSPSNSAQMKQIVTE